MGTALKLAIARAAELPEAAQEQLGRELLDRIEALTQLRAEIDVGIRELDAGLGEALDVEKLIEQLHAGPCRRKIVGSFGRLLRKKIFAISGVTTLEYPHSSKSEGPQLALGPL